MKPSLFVFGSAACLLASCSDLLKVPTIRPKAAKQKKFTESEEGGGIAGNPFAKVTKPNEDSALGDVAPEEAGFLPARVGKGVTAGGFELPSDDEIVWAPTNLNAEIPFDEAFKNRPTKKVSWLSSYQDARRESMRSGKPLLIWFTRTGSPASPKCVTLNRELFATHEFSTWAKESIVRLKVDASGGVDNKGRFEGVEVDRRKYAQKLKEQYHVLGFPSLIVLQPDGGVFKRMRGYKKGSNNELWDSLKNAALTAEHNREVYERRMAKKGYREWTGKNKGVVFAKLSRFDEKSGTTWLTEPDGNVIKTSTKFISKDDRGWILAEKERRGL